MSITEAEFLELLKTTKAIKCNHPNVLAGELLYHVLAIYDDTVVAVKYFGNHKQWWHYQFYDITTLFLFYNRGWIELRNKS
jgi:hypothetical protein